MNLRACFILFAITTVSVVALGQDSSPGARSASKPEPPAEADKANSGAPAAPSLGDDQESVGRRYREFESTLQRIADLMARNDPDRAALLAKAFSRSKSDLIEIQFRRLAENLEKGEYESAIKDQEALIADLKGMLELLLSEDRARELRDERERLEKQLKDIKELQRRQKDLRSETERRADSAEAKKLAEKQGKIAEDTQRVAKDAKGDSKDAASDPSKKGESSKSQSGGKPKPGEPKKGDNPGPSQESPEQQSDSPEQQQRAKAAEQLESAREAMEQARKELEKLRREPASKAQDEAIKNLEKAVSELEEILRQLREEERLQVLEALEARFKKMLEMQLVVRDGTANLDRVPAEKRTRADEQKALALSQREQTLVEEIDQALFVLREDGTAVAFPEAVEQIREDAGMIVSLLARADTGSLTQGLEADVIAALEEMIAAVRRKIQEAKDQQAQAGEQGSPGERALVDQLAELKMIRSLSQRVLERTRRLTKEQTEASSKLAPAEVKRAIDDLVERQARVFEITHEIVVGKNR